MIKRTAILYAICSTLSGTAISGGFIPKLNGANTNSEWTSTIYDIPRSQQRGSADFAKDIDGNTGYVRVFSQSNSTTTVGTTTKHTLTELSLGYNTTSNNNPLVSSNYGCSNNAFNRLNLFRLSLRELNAANRGEVRLDFRFGHTSTAGAIENLHVFILDVDEGSTPSTREMVTVRAYSTFSGSRSDSLNPRQWPLLAQGDLSLDIGAGQGSINEFVLPPFWYIFGNFNNQSSSTWGSRLITRKKSNQNRDFTVFKIKEATKRLIVDFRGPRAGDNTEIGSHVYVGIWHENQNCASAS